MVNFVIQYNVAGHDFSNDQTYKMLNHFHYTHFSYVDEGFRIDYLQHNQDAETRFLVDEDVVLFYLGNILFKEDQFNTVQQLRKIYFTGKSLIEEIESGRFVIVIYDKKEEKLMIVNDRFGLIPFFKYNDNSNFIFSTEPKGILNSLLVKGKKFRLDYAAVANYFNYRYILGNKYFLKEIRKQDPASILTFHLGEINNTIYWTFEPTFDKRTTNEMLDNLLNTFQQGLQKNKKKYLGNYVCDISGGYDSRFIYLNSSKIKHVMTIGEPDCYQFKYVQETLKLKPANLLNVQSEASKDKFLKLLDLTDLTGDIGCPQTIDVIRTFQNDDHMYQYEYNGFLGDAILGGEYLNIRKEVKREFGIKAKYKKEDLNLKNFNDALLNEDFKKKLDQENDLWIYLNDNFSNLNTDFSLRRNLIIFKTYNRGLNQINSNGSLLLYKYVNVFFPFFYYPFFDLYIKIHLDDLRLRKAYTSLFKKLPKKYLQLGDDKFILPFSYPHKLRILIFLIYKIMDKIEWIPIQKKRIYDFSKDFIENEELIKWFKAKLNNKKYKKILNQDYLDKLFDDKRLLMKNYDYLNRCVGFILFLEKYDNIET